MNGTFDSRLLRRVFVCRTMSRWLDEDSNTSGGFHLDVVVREGPQWFTLATNFIRPASDLSLNFFDKKSLYRISMLGFVIYWYLIDTLLALIKWYLISLLVLIRSGPWRPNWFWKFGLEGRAQKGRAKWGRENKRPVTIRPVQSFWSKFTLENQLIKE